MRGYGIFHPFEGRQKERQPTSAAAADEDDDRVFCLHSSSSHQQQKKILLLYTQLRVVQQLWRSLFVVLACWPGIVWILYLDYYRSRQMMSIPYWLG